MHFSSCKILCACYNFRKLKESKMKKFISLPYIFVMVLSLMLVGCQGGETIKIGTLLDKTGDLGSYGPPMEIGADLAIKL